MSTELKIPSLGQGMSEGTLTEWLVREGAHVLAGDSIYSLESEKSVQEIQAPASGVLRTIGKPGEVYPVGTIVGRIE